MSEFITSGNNFRKSQRACEKLDLEQSIDQPAISWFWPIRDKPDNEDSKSEDDGESNKEDADEDEDEGDEIEYEVSEIDGLFYFIILQMKLYFKF